MQKDFDLTKEQLEEINELFKQLKQIEKQAEKSRKENWMSEIAATLVFIFTGSVMLFIESRVIGYFVWIALFGFLLYYIFGVRKSDVPEYDDCARAAKCIVSNCIKIIEHNQVAEVVYNDPKFYIEKYNKLIGYYPCMASKTLNGLVSRKPKSKNSNL